MIIYSINRIYNHLKNNNFPENLLITEGKNVLTSENVTIDDCSFVTLNIIRNVLRATKSPFISISEIQRFLNTTFAGRIPQLEVDGRLGRLTLTALLYYYNLYHQAVDKYNRESKHSDIKLVDVAVSHIGETELSNNAGFVNKQFQALMVAAGFVTGHAWCSYFTEMCYREVVGEVNGISQEIRKAINGSTQTSLRNLIKLGASVDKLNNKINLVLFHKPLGEGAFNYFQSVNKPTQGHVGITKTFDINDTYNDTYQNVEGNTTDGKSPSREGVMVATKTYIVATKSIRSLRNQGFINLSYLENLLTLKVVK